MNSQQYLNFLKEYQNTKEAKALLKTIQYAEGTKRPGDDSYRVMFGGSLFPKEQLLIGHPDKVIHGERHSSAAAGAYQFMPFTWANVKNKLGFSKGFTPNQQDLGALFLARERYVPYGGLAGLTKDLQAGKFADVFARLSPEWAALPTKGGSSFYSGQSAKDLARLTEVYREELQKAENLPTPTTPTKPNTGITTPFPGVEVVINNGGGALLPPKNEQKNQSPYEYLIESLISNMLSLNTGGKNYYDSLLNPDADDDDKQNPLTSFTNYG